MTADGKWLLNPTRAQVAGRPTLYLAGKIGPLDWRHQVFGEKFGSLPDSVGCCWEDDAGDLLDPRLRLDIGSCLVTGPFFISCDHGCRHGPASHGVSASGSDGDLMGDDLDGRREAIVKVNARRLAAADIVYAFIDAADCYGTMIELGMATALRKNVVVAFSSDLPEDVLEDMWMAEVITTFPRKGKIMLGDVEQLDVTRRNEALLGTAAECWEQFEEYLTARTLVQAGRLLDRVGHLSPAESLGVN